VYGNEELHIQPLCVVQWVGGGWIIGVAVWYIFLGNEVGWWVRDLFDVGLVYGDGT